MRSFWLLGFALVACTTVPTVAEEDPSILSFAETLREEGVYELLLESQLPARPIEAAEMSVAGYLLELKSPFCVVEGCLPNEAGYVRLTFPDEPEANYGTSIVVEVVGGVPIKGVAHANLSGEKLTRPATLVPLDEGI